MSYVKVWIHIVFSTKNREPILNKEIIYQLKHEIRQNCKANNIFLKAVNGYTDHLHCLISLGREQTISKIVQIIKGGSALWLNNYPFMQDSFMWQDDYFAISVSESQLETVVQYIRNQEKHHLKKSFDQEAEEFKIKLGWKIDKG